MNMMYGPACVPFTHSRGAPVTAISPHLVVADADRAAAWYVEALGAQERSRVPVPGMGVLAPPSIGGTPVALHLTTEDVDVLWQRALDAGAEVHSPLQDAFWGERHGQIIDPFGHRWGLAQHVRDVPHDQIVQAAAQAFGG